MASRSGGLASVLLSLFLVAACTPAASRAFLRDEDLAHLQPDTKETCLVAAQILGGFGDLQGGIKLATTAGEQVTAGVTGAFLKGGSDGFAFVNVPKGPFRVSYINYYRYTGKGKDIEVNIFDNLNHGHALSNNNGVGDVPNEMSGTCNGGFIWLGVFMGERGGLFTQPKIKPKADAVGASYAIADLKAKLAGTPWAAEIDHPAESKPLPEGQAVVEKVDPVKAAAAAKAASEAGRANVAKMMAQTRPVTLPPSDAGVLATVAGLYVLEAINGKKMPYTYENKCTMLDGQYDLKTDGAYATTANMDCAGVTYPFPTSGLFGVVGGKVTWAVGVGPPAVAVTTIGGGTMTIVAGADTYTYNRH